MNIELYQKRTFSYRKFILQNDKIFVEIKTIKRIDKFDIAIDRIGFDIHYQADNIIIGKIFLYICLILPVILLIVDTFFSKMETGILVINFLIWWFLALINILKEHQDDICLIGGQKNLIFFRDKPNEKSVLEFIDNIINASKMYLKKKYTNLDLYHNLDEFNNAMLWLKDKKVIDEIECDKLKEKFNIKQLIN